MHTITMLSRAYEVDDKDFEKILEMAKNAVPCGIYALEYPSHTEIRNDIMSKTQTKKARRYYKSQGVKAYVSGI